MTRAFEGMRLLGVDWSLGAVLSCALVGLAHAFRFSQGAFNFDPVITMLTALPSLIAAWIVLKTRCVLLSIFLHNFGNAISFLI